MHDESEATPYEMKKEDEKVQFFPANSINIRIYWIQQFSIRNLIYVSLKSDLCESNSQAGLDHYACLLKAPTFAHLHYSLGGIRG